MTWQSCTSSQVSGACNTDDINIPTIPGNTPQPKIPTKETVTEATLDGDGVFDLYMRAGLVQLQSQYDQGRIKGADYAQAYVALVELMMTQANQFVLGLVKAEIEAAMFPVQYLTAGYDAAAKVEAAKKGQCEAALVAQQTAELKANGASERGLKCAQTDAQRKTIELYDRQIKGFNDKFETDVYKIIMDAWAAQGAEISTNPAVSELAFLTKSGIEAGTTPTFGLTAGSFMDTMVKRAGVTVP